MPALDPTSPQPAGSGTLEARLLQFVNEVLPQIDRRGRTWAPVDVRTLLFATGLLDSLSILHLITRLEELTGRPVPDSSWS